MACSPNRGYSRAVRRLHVISRALSSHNLSPTLLVEPSDALVDEPLSITVSGLERHQKITLSAVLRVEGKEFASCSHYTADGDGCVDTAVQSSEGGSFTGIEPQGLLWAMTAQKSSSKRLLIKDITRPYDVTISVHSDHMDLKATQSSCNTSSVLDTAHVRRRYMRDGVQRIPVRKGRLRGTMFIPVGKGPFPAVLDMFGGTGGLFEFRAALLASRGFLTFALAYLSYDGLPRVFHELDFDYFLEAAEMLNEHPNAQSGGIGVIGSSFGGAVTNMLASFCDKVKAAIAINGIPVSPLRDQDVNGETVIGDIRNFGENQVIISNLHVLPIWRLGSKLLHLVSEDDQLVFLWVYRLIMEKVPEDKKHNVQSVYFPGAGHLLEPPYTPLCRESYVRAGVFFAPSNVVLYLTCPEIAAMKNIISLGLSVHKFSFQRNVILWGGETKAHAVAQEDSWKRILEHFHSYLPKRNV